MCVFLSFSLCPSRSIASITAVNGKTGIDNLLLVIYQRYFFSLFVFSLEAIPCAEWHQTVRSKCKRSPSNFEIIMVIEKYLYRCVVVQCNFYKIISYKFSHIIYIVSDQNIIGVNISIVCICVRA